MRCRQRSRPRAGAYLVASLIVLAASPAAAQTAVLLPEQASGARQEDPIGAECADAVVTWGESNLVDFIMKADVTVEDLALAAGCEPDDSSCLPQLGEMTEAKRLLVIVLEPEGEMWGVRLRVGETVGVWQEGSYRAGVAPADVVDTVLADAATLLGVEQVAAADEPPPPAEDLDEPGVYRAMRVVPKGGVAIPRGELALSGAALLEVAYVLPLYAMFDTDNAFVADRFRLFAEGGYQLLANQADTIVPGRGRTAMVQNTTVFPVRVGLAWSGPADWVVRPVASAAYALLITRTEFDLFWQTVPQNDVSSGVAASLGVETTFAFGPGVDGVLVVEAVHVEASADLGALGDAGESTLSGTSALAGFGVQF